MWKKRERETESASCAERSLEPTVAKQHWRRALTDLRRGHGRAVIHSACRRSTFMPVTCSPSRTLFFQSNFVPFPAFFFSIFCPLHLDEACAERQKGRSRGRSDSRFGLELKSHERRRTPAWDEGARGTRGEQLSMTTSFGGDSCI